MLKIIVGANEEQRRLDRFLRQYFDKAPLALIYRLIRKDVKVNGRRSSREVLLEEGDEILVYLSEEEAASLRSERRPRRAKVQFTTVYEDESLLAVGKPPGLLVHGDDKEKKNTLVNQVEGYLMDKGEYHPGREQVFRPAAVNRLDRNTGGLVLFGKTAEALREYSRLMADKEAVDKEYLALVAGSVKAPLELGGYLLREEGKNRSYLRKEPADPREGKSRAVATLVQPEICGRRCSLVRVRLLTGRTHQIRLHLAEAGHPILGDPKYGDPKLNRQLKEDYGLSYQLLHCERMRFHRGSLAGKSLICPPFRRFLELQEALLGEGNKPVKTQKAPAKTQKASDRKQKAPAKRTKTADGQSAQAKKAQGEEGNKKRRRKQR